MSRECIPISDWQGSTMCVRRRCGDMRSRGQWQIGREEAEKQILRRCLMATAKLLETAAAGATERLESGEGSLKEVKELGGILQALVGTAAKMCQSEKNKDTAVNEIRVIMSEEVEALSR